MAESDELLPLYLHLARASQRRNRPWVRDKLLVLSGAAAAERGLDMVASFCRRTILANNPRHIVGHYPTMALALEDERFQRHLAQLRRRYTRERAEHMLSSLGINLAREREAYFTLHEYAAALLGTTPAELDALFGDVDEAGDVTNPRLNPYPSPSGDEMPRYEPVRSGQPGLWIALGLVALLSLAAAWLGAARWLAW
ncbi:MAG TPA: hypothetical protein VMV69_26245 [Pirellulales bacterium]|nr:hypothetical protein [Pirellulales bacterium]